VAFFVTLFAGGFAGGSLLLVGVVGARFTASTVLVKATNRVMILRGKKNQSQIEVDNGNIRYKR
jgi:hypothetical protein